MANINYASFKGRTLVTTQFEEITSANIVDVFEDVKETLSQNLQQSVTLYDYYLGDQSIYSRVKLVRPEINNQVVENRAYEIVNFKKGYQYGTGCSYVSSRSDEGMSDILEKINFYNGYIGKDKADIEHLEDMLITGRGYRLIRMKSDDKEEKNELVEVLEDADNLDYEIHRLDARFGDMIFTNDLVPKPLGYMHYAQDENGQDLLYVYTKDAVITMIDGEVKSDDHSLGYIPVVMTKLNESMLGCFEPILGMLDALNTLQSDRMNAIEQFVQSILILQNVDFDEKEAKMSLSEILASGAGLKVKDRSGDGNNQAKVYFLTQELSQVGTQTLKADILSAINDITAIPDRMGSDKSSGDTGIAVELRDGWANAETYARNVDPYLKSSEKELVKLITLCYNMGNSGKANPMSIEPKFNRNPRADRVNGAQAMMNEIAIGIDPLTVIANSGLYTDPEKVYELSKDAIVAIRDGDTTERTENTDQRELGGQTQGAIINE